MSFRPRLYSFYRKAKWAEWSFRTILMVFCINGFSRILTLTEFLMRTPYLSVLGRVSFASSRRSTRRRARSWRRTSQRPWSWCRPARRPTTTTSNSPERSTATCRPPSSRPAPAAGAADYSGALGNSSASRPRPDVITTRQVKNDRKKKEKHDSFDGWAWGRKEWQLGCRWVFPFFFWRNI